MALDQFVQGLARSPLGNLPALMQQKQALDRQKKIDQQRAQQAERERQRQLIKMQTTSQLDSYINAAKTPEEREELLGQAAMGLQSMGFPDAAKFYQSERDMMAEERMSLEELNQKMTLARMKESGMNRRATIKGKQDMQLAKMKEAGLNRRAEMKEKGANERHLANLLQNERQFEAQQRIRESANDRSQEEHILAMERGAFELDQAYVDAANNDMQMAEKRLAQGWHDLTNGGTIEGFHRASDIINGKMQQDPGLYQQLLGLPDHRIPVGVDVIPGERGQPMVAFEIQNTKTGTTGPMTKNASAGAGDRVQAIPLSSFNRMMRSTLGLEDPHDEIRDNMNQLFKEGGMMAAMPEGRKDQQVAVTDLALQAYDFTGDIRVAEKIAGIFTNEELPEVKRFWNAKTLKAQSKARDDIIALVAPYAREALMEPSLKSVVPEKKKAEPMRDDPRAVMPRRDQSRYTENPINPAMFP